MIRMLKKATDWWIVLLQSPWVWQHIKSLMSMFLDDFTPYHSLLRRHRWYGSPLCGPMLSTSSISAVALTGYPSASGEKALRIKSGHATERKYCECTRRSENVLIKNFFPTKGRLYLRGTSLFLGCFVLRAACRPVDISSWFYLGGWSPDPRTTSEPHKETLMLIATNSKSQNNANAFLSNHLRI